MSAPDAGDTCGMLVVGAGLAGLTAGFDQAVTRGAVEANAASRKFSIYYFRTGKLIAIDSLNQSGDHLTGRKLLDKGVSPTPTQAADSGFDIASLLTA